MSTICGYRYKKEEPIFNLETSTIYTEDQLHNLIAKYIQEHPDDEISKSFNLRLFSTQSDVVSKITKIHRETEKISSDEAIGVHSLSTFQFPKGIINQSSSTRFVPEYIEVNRIENHKSLQNSGLTEKQKDAIVDAIVNNSFNNLSEEEHKQKAMEIKEQLIREAQVAPIGEFFHAILQIYFDKKGNVTDDDFSVIKNKFINTFNKTDSIKGICNEKAKDINAEDSFSKIKEIASKSYTQLVNKFGKNSTYLTEQWISVGQNQMTQKVRSLLPKNIKGRMDLVVIDENGKVNIIDFKLSTKPFGAWFNSKRYSLDYQLGIYRAMLSAHGFDETQIGLYCLPVSMDYGDIRTLTLNSGLGSNESSPIKNMTILDGNYLNARDGKFSTKIHEVINTTIPTDVDQRSEDVEKIIEHIHQVVTPFEAKREMVSKEELTKKIKQVKDNNKNKFALYDIIKQEYMFADTMEEFTKKDGIIDKYIKRLENKNTEMINNLTLQIDEYIKSGNSSLSSLREFLNYRGRNNYALESLNRNLNRYLNGNWTRIDSIKLQSLGILAFQHNDEPRDIEFVFLTNYPLNQILDIGKGQTVLGKFLSNNEIENIYPNLDVMESTVGNLMLLKMATAINDIPELFSHGQRIGRMVVIDYTSGETTPADIEQLQDNFKIATKQAGIKDNFSKQKRVNLWETVCVELNNLIKPHMQIDEMDKKEVFYWDDAVKQMVKDLNRNETNQAQIIESITNLMQLLRKRYSDQLVRENVEVAWKAITEPQIVYSILASALGYYTDTEVQDTGKPSKWGASFGEILRYLGTPFPMFQAGHTYRDKNGNEYVGFGQGLNMTTPTTVTNKNLQKLYKYVTEAFLAIRAGFNEQAKYINDITKEFESTRVSTTQRIVLGYVDNIWNDLIEKEHDDKQFSSLFRVKNPFENNTDLDRDQKKFLKRILWEINKYILDITELQNLHWDGNEDKILNNEKVKKAIDEGIYFEIPLKRARSTQEIMNMGRIGVSDYFKKRIDRLTDEIDYRGFDSTIRENVDRRTNKDFVDFVNPYDLSSSLKNKNLRQSMLEKNGVYSYEIDLNFIALDLAYYSIKEEKITPILLAADAFSIQMQQLSIITGKDYSTELESLHNYIDSKVLNKSIIDKEFHQHAKVISAARRVNSFLHLSGRPLQFVKEMTVGTFTNVSRAWANSGREGKFKMKSLLKAYQILFSVRAKKASTDLFGDSDFADFTLMQQLNQEYGIANDDMNTMVSKRRYNRHGLFNGANDALYISNTAPDFVNRMALFLAQMDHDGCLDAHILDKDGIMHYHFDKDQRFSLLKCTGDNVVCKNGNENDKKYLKQKALYRAMLNEFINSNTRSKDGKLLKFGMELPRAYTVAQRQDIKEFSNLAYGFYDNEEKSLMDDMFIGLIWKQFMTFWTAKLTLWLKANNKYSAQGKYDFKRNENGEQLYKLFLFDESGNIIGYEETTQSKDKEGNELEPIIEWQEQGFEGLIYSIGYTLESVLKLDFNSIINNKQRLANLKIALHDILIGILGVQLLKMMFTEDGEGDVRDVNPDVQIAYMTMYRAFREFDPVDSLTSINWTPSFYTTLVNVQNDVFKLLTDDKNLQYFLQRNFGAVSDWTIKTRDNDYT